MTSPRIDPSRRTGLRRRRADYTAKEQTYDEAFNIRALVGVRLGVAGTAQAQMNEIVLHNFSLPTGAQPVAGVIRDSAGNLYGTTANGGTVNLGVVYKLDRTGRYTVLYNFAGGPDGGVPEAGVIRDSAGNLYGTNFGGPGVNLGVVYELDAAGNYTVLYTFTGGADGANPNGVIRDSAGNLYGTTIADGIANSGVVYKLDTAGNYTVLYTFMGG